MNYFLMYKMMDRDRKGKISMQQSTSTRVLMTGCFGCKFTVEHSGTTQKAKITEQVENKTYPTEYAEGNDDHLTS